MGRHRYVPLLDVHTQWVNGVLAMPTLLSQPKWASACFFKGSWRMCQGSAWKRHKHQSWWAGLDGCKETSTMEQEVDMQVPKGRAQLTCRCFLCRPRSSASVLQADHSRAAALSVFKPLHVTLISYY